WAAGTAWAREPGPVAAESSGAKRFGTAVGRRFVIGSEAFISFLSLARVHCLEAIRVPGKNLSKKILLSLIIRLFHNLSPRLLSRIAQPVPNPSTGTDVSGTNLSSILIFITERMFFPIGAGP